MQNWEHLDFWEHKVEGREKKEKNEKPHMVYQQQVHFWEAVRITLPTPSLCNVKGYSLRNSESIPTTQKIKLPLQAVRQELAFKTFPRKLDTDLYYHIWKQLLHSQGPTEESAQSMEKVVLPILLLLGQKGCNLIFV